MHKKIRFATIGTNFIVDSFLRASQKVNEFELAAVYSRSYKKAQQLIGERENITIYTDLSALAKAEDIDAIYIASPTSLHYSQSMQMLKHGKHVLCEKPIASNAYELKEMLAVAKENNVMLLEAMRPLYSPTFDMIKSSMDKLGPLRMAELSFCQYSSRYDKFKQGIVENAFKPEFSNGALMDIGIYCIEVMVGLFGEPNSVISSGYIIPESIDGYGHTIAAYQGFEVCLRYSKVTSSKAACEVQGEHGTLYFDHCVTPENIWIVYNDGARENVLTEQFEDDMRFEIQTFIDLVKDNKAVNIGKDISQTSIALIDKIRKQVGIVFPSDRV